MEFEQIKQQILSGERFVTADSRCVKAGGVFVAVRGATVDGHAYISQAIDNGARYIVAEADGGQAGAEFIIVKSGAKAAGILAQAQAGDPASKMTALAVTGTNGKTTTAFLVRAIIRHAGQKCGMIGTVIYDDGAEEVAAPLTTPDAFTAAELTRKMVGNGAKYFIAEASSHSLDQGRLCGIDFKAAAFTNLSGDHLDYHKTTEQYLDAKSKLFEGLAADSVAVLNRESDYAETIAAKTKAKVMWYSTEGQADIRAEISRIDIDGITFELFYGGESVAVSTPLIGKYNLENCLAAAGLCLAGGFKISDIAKGIESLKAIPGRCEKIDNDKGFAVLVDYAHTDDALRNVLVTLRGLCAGRLITVFGCGGDRDKSKRPRMGKAAQEFADVVIVTSDNPRSEEPLSIIEDVKAGLDKDKGEIFIEADRDRAIAVAIEKAADGDIILIAGKGHEDYQVLADKTIHFDDREKAKEYLLKK